MRVVSAVVLDGVVVVVVVNGRRGRNVDRIGVISLGISVVSSMSLLIGVEEGISGSGASVIEFGIDVWTSSTVSGCVSGMREKDCSGGYVSVVSVFGVEVEASSSSSSFSSSSCSSGDTEVLRRKVGRKEMEDVTRVGLAVVVVVVVVVIVVVSGTGFVVATSSVDSSSESSLSSTATVFTFWRLIVEYLERVQRCH